MNHYQINAFVKAQKSKSMTQQEIKKLASEIIGDGQSPNQWFVTTGPYIRVLSADGYGYETEELEGFKDTEATFGPFDTYEDAVECFEDQCLDVGYGIGEAFIEDRQCGLVREKFLTKKLVVEYVEDEHDDSARFYKK
jgi:hypothetical protein